jgi:transcriptional regulator with XRE-family HTH domain
MNETVGVSCMEKLEIRRPEDLGLAVSEARRAIGLTQTQLAERSGVERSYLAKLEAGLNTLLLDRSLRLLRRLGARVIVELPASSGSDTDRVGHSGGDTEDH